MVVARNARAPETGTALARLERLVSGEAGSTLPDSLREDLSSALQELQVMDEELRQQNEDLAEANVTIEAQRSRYRELFDLAPDGYLVTDPSGIILEANRAAALRLGVAQTRLAGKALVLYLESGCRRELFSFLERIAKAPQGTRLDWECTVVPRRGAKRFPAILTAVLAYNPAGAARGVHLLFHDITTRVQSEQELRATQEGLERRTSELAQSNAELRASLAEKEVLLREVHHRVKNNLQVITSLLNLQAAQLHDDAERAPFLECQNRVHGIALVHERLYQSRNLSHVDMDPYVRALASDLLRSYSVGTCEVTLRLEIDEIGLRVEAVIPVGLILTELVSNALRHAFRGRTGGEIAISMRRLDASRLRLEVTDNGVGLPDNVDPGTPSRSASSWSAFWRNSSTAAWR